MHNGRAVIICIKLQCSGNWEVFNMSSRIGVLRIRSKKKRVERQRTAVHFSVPRFCVADIPYILCSFKLNFHNKLWGFCPIPCLGCAECRARSAAAYNMENPGKCSVSLFLV